MDQNYTSFVDVLNSRKFENASGMISENDVEQTLISGTWDVVCRRLRSTKIPHVHFHCWNATNIQDFERNNRNVDTRNPLQWLPLNFSAQTFSIEFSWII